MFRESIHFKSYLVLQYSSPTLSNTAHFKNIVNLLNCFVYKFNLKLKEHKTNLPTHSLRRLAPAPFSARCRQQCDALLVFLTFL